MAMVLREMRLTEPPGPATTVTVSSLEVTLAVSSPSSVCMSSTFDSGRSTREILAWNSPNASRSRSISVVTGLTGSLLAWTVRPGSRRAR